MKRFLSVLLVTFILLTLTVFATDDFVNSFGANEPSSEEIVDVPGDQPSSGDDSPQTGIVPVAAIAGVAVLAVGAVGVVAFRKKES